MNGPGFGPLENFSRFDHLYDCPEDVADHRDDCKSVEGRACNCSEIDASDKAAEIEERADEIRKYGEGY